MKARWRNPEQLWTEGAHGRCIAEVSESRANRGTYLIRLKKVRYWHCVFNEDGSIRYWQTQDDAKRAAETLTGAEEPKP